MDIKKGNLLIRDFMEVSPMVYGDWSIAVSINNGLYHSDWNWLMLCVEKIESQGLDVIINTTTCVINDVGEDRFDPFEGYSTNSKIDAVYYTVVKYINWYNENNK